MMEKLVAENDALTDHLNKQALELGGLRAAMAAAAQFAQAADADAAAAEAAAAAAVGYLPPASPMRQMSGGLGGLQRQLSDASAAAAAAAGLPSPPRPTSSFSPSQEPVAAAAGGPATSGRPPSAQPPSSGGTPGGGAARGLPGGGVLSEQPQQLLSMAEEVGLLELLLMRPALCHPLSAAWARHACLADAVPRRRCRLRGCSWSCRGSAAGTSAWRRSWRTRPQPTSTRLPLTGQRTAAALGCQARRASGEGTASGSGWRALMWPTPRRRSEPRCAAALACSTAWRSWAAPPVPPLMQLAPAAPCIFPLWIERSTACIQLGLANGCLCWCLPLPPLLPRCPMPHALTGPLPDMHGVCICTWSLHLSGLMDLL
jgi:hypothetical protein